MNAVDKTIRDYKDERLAFDQPEVGRLVREIERLRSVVSDVIVVANSGALKDFDGEPWLNRVLTTDL